MLVGNSSYIFFKIFLSILSLCFYAACILYSMKFTKHFSVIIFGIFIAIIIIVIIVNICMHLRCNKSFRKQTLTLIYKHHKFLYIFLWFIYMGIISKYMVFWKFFHKSFAEIYRRNVLT